VQAHLLIFYEKKKEKKKERKKTINTNSIPGKPHQIHLHPACCHLRMCVAASIVAKSNFKDSLVVIKCAGCHAYKWYKHKEYTTRTICRPEKTKTLL
jgi:ribonuclease HII